MLPEAQGGSCSNQAPPRLPTSLLAGKHLPFKQSFSTEDTCTSELKGQAILLPSVLSSAAVQLEVQRDRAVKAKFPAPS